MTPEFHARLSAIECEQAEFRQAVREIRDLSQRQADSLESLVRLEERHGESREALSRAFATLKDHDTRMGAIEREMPGLLETRRWVVSGIIGLVAIIGIAVAGLVVNKPAASVPRVIYETPIR